MNEVIRSRHTTSRNIYDLADSYRQSIREQLIEPLKEHAVTICPDFWCDPYKSISYLGLNVCFIDADYRYVSIDLFCRPFFGIKSSEQVIKVGHLFKYSAIYKLLYH